MDENGEDYGSGEESPPYGYFSDDESSGQFCKSCAHSTVERYVCCVDGDISLDGRGGRTESTGDSPTGPHSAAPSSEG